MSDFPPSSPTLKEDSSGFSMEQADPAIKVKAEGGYAMSRPRYTRTPPRKIMTKFTAIKESDRALLEAFWNSKKGGSVIFTYTIPPTNEEINVRFGKSMKYKYKGTGGTHLWDVENVELEEV